MPPKFHPKQGSIVIVDYRTGFTPPEMVKRRLAVVLTPEMTDRPDLCAVVPLSTTQPLPMRPYHTELNIRFMLPKPWADTRRWVKGDMVAVIALNRIELLRFKQQQGGRRRYQTTCLDDITFKRVQRCALHGLGFSSLTKYL